MLTFFQTIVVVTWAMVLMNSPGSQVGWFALHPPLQTLAIFAFTFGTPLSKISIFYVSGHLLSQPIASSRYYYITAY